MTAPICHGFAGLSRFFGPISGIFLLMLVGNGASACPENEPSLTELLEQIPGVASEGAGMNSEERALATAIAEHGVAAADSLVGLLDSEDEEIYQLVRPLID